MAIIRKFGIVTASGDRIFAGETGDGKAAVDIVQRDGASAAIILTKEEYTELLVQAKNVVFK